MKQVPMVYVEPLLEGLVAFSVSIKDLPELLAQQKVPDEVIIALLEKLKRYSIVLGRNVHHSLKNLNFTPYAIAEEEAVKRGVPLW